jgi:hypothetical protein
MPKRSDVWDFAKKVPIEPFIIVKNLKYKKNY